MQQGSSTGLTAAWLEVNDDAPQDVQPARARAFFTFLSVSLLGTQSKGYHSNSSGVAGALLPTPNRRAPLLSLRRPVKTKGVPIQEFLHMSLDFEKDFRFSFTFNSTFPAYAIRMAKAALLYTTTSNANCHVSDSL